MPFFDVVKLIILSAAFQICAHSFFPSSLFYSLCKMKKRKLTKKGKECIRTGTEKGKKERHVRGQERRVSNLTESNVRKGKKK